MLANKIMGATSAAPDVNYIEDVFSTYLYTGNGATQTITNGIDISGKGGLVWIKDRTVGYSHSLFDTARGVTNRLLTNGTGEEISYPTSVTAFNNNGFTTGAFSNTNQSGSNLVSWTFRKQAKFFDIVTWTGNGSSPRAISHSLNSAPGCIIVKAYSASGAGENWTVYHRGLNGGTTPQNFGIYLNTTAAEADEAGFWSDTAPTSTQFTVGGNLNSGFGGGVSYVAYLFAHDAGGFGLSGNENVVSCGSYTVSTLAQITLGYEPQLLLVRKSDGAGSNWFLLDSMRDFSLTNSAYLRPNVSSIESSSGAPGFFSPTATGFIDNNQTFTNGDKVIYIAIRRGPMAVPTLATTVFNSVARTGTGGTATVEPGFVTDLIIDQRRSAGGDGGVAWDRLRGAERYLFTRTTAAEGTTSNSLTSFANMNGVTVGADGGQVINVSGVPWINWMFRRAPGFMDVVCYTGQQGVLADVRHNLGVIPELYILKTRSNARSWLVAGSLLGQNGLTLNASSASFFQLETFPSFDTASTIRIDPYSNYNVTGQTQVVYLFASAPGVSKVGSYTGTGTTQAINCGFTAGARFVLIKRTDSTGDWYVWDSARGIVAGNDPYLLLNSTAAEVTSTDYIDPVSSGFEISSTAPAAINASGGSYIFLAVA